MKKLNIKAPIVFYIAMLLLTGVLFTSRLTGGLYARYQTKATASASARVAAFAFTIGANDQVTTMLPYNGVRAANGSMVYCVTVTNKTGDRVSEVAQTYSLSASNLTENIPLNFAFFSDAACTQAATPSGSFTPATEQSATFYLKISLNGTPDASCADEVDMIRITATSTQID